MEASEGTGRNARRGKIPVIAAFLALASLNLFVLVQANQLAFSQQQQPYDFYVLLHASSQVVSAPALVYVHQDVSALSPYWSNWLWYGASYLYTPMFATLLSPLASLNPPDAKLAWEGISYVLLLTACAAVLRIVPSTKARLFLTLLIFIMPFQVVYTDQTLPQYWLHQMAGMWVSPIFFADYYWGKTNTAVLALGLLSYYFAMRREPIEFGVASVPSYAFSALFLALDTFMPTATLLILPFWLVMSRRNILPSLGFFFLFLVALNGIVFFEPTLLTGYISALAVEPQAAHWQVNEYVWYYTLPLTGTLLLWQGREPRPFSQ